MSTVREGFNAIFQEPANRIVISRFLRVAVAVAVAPVAVYFLTYAFVRELSLPSHGIYSPSILAGLAAVLTLNGITAAFALHAALEKLSPQPSATPSLSSPSNIDSGPGVSEDEISESTDLRESPQDTTTALRPKTE